MNSPASPGQTPTPSVNEVSQELPPLPSPLTQVSVHDDEYGHREQSADDDYYTADQMLAFYRQGWRDGRASGEKT